ncbi:hypothetical protein L210DRAFT_3534512 [Boletus edulis BED1]|uniref:Uncharacterized protein n=1 Tax=Boletus edulis BED1 TaxID=1328754 RepID=A0AAD4GG37_BOLED|nr:hypothetical protein L210DRAFT_3534512 [Boletus edulis BED1]
MHDDFVRNPPKNVAGNDVPSSKPKWAVPNKTVIQSGVLGQEELGRIKQSDVQSGLVEENSLHS